MITKNQVYTRIATAFRSAYPEGVVYGSRVAVPSAFPAVWCVESDSYPLRRYTTLDFEDRQRRSVFELQAFSSEPTIPAAEITALCEAAFRKIGYRKILDTPVDNTADPNIQRQFARFERMIGGGDTLPEIE